jgi:hypothetical protein
MEEPRKKGDEESVHFDAIGCSARRPEVHCHLQTDARNARKQLRRKDAKSGSFKAATNEQLSLFLNEGGAFRPFPSLSLFLKPKSTFSRAASTFGCKRPETAVPSKREPSPNHSVSKGTAFNGKFAWSQSCMEHGRRNRRARVLA